MIIRMVQKCSSLNYILFINKETPFRAERRVLSLFLSFRRLRDEHFSNDPLYFFFTAFISNNSDRGFICWLQKISRKTAAWPDAKVDYRTNTRHSSTFLTCIMRCSADLILKREIKIISLTILFHLFFYLLCLFL